MEKHRHWKQSFVIFVATICAFFINVPLSQADDTAVDYTIEGVPHEKQIDKNAGYFFLKESPNEKDEIKVKLLNSSDEDKTLCVKVVDANTNVNGIVDYSGSLENHPSLKVPLTSIVKETQKEVVVPKNSEVETILTVTMPSEKMKGIVLGGVVVSEKQEKDSDPNKAGISNTYSYTLAIVLTNDEKTPIKQNISVELESVRARLYDGSKVVQASILNPNPYIFDEATVEGTIYEKDSDKKVKDKVMEHVSIAPYSVFPFQFDWEKENLKPGTYKFVGTVTSGEDKWTFEKEFEITAEESKKINEESVFKVYIPKWLMNGEIALSVISCLGTIILFVRKQRRE